MPATAHRIDALVRERPGISRGELCRAIGTDVDSALRRLVQVGYIRRTVRRATPVIIRSTNRGTETPKPTKGATSHPRHQRHGQPLALVSLSEYGNCATIRARPAFSSQKKSGRSVAGREGRPWRDGRQFVWGVTRRKDGLACGRQALG